MTIDVDTVVVVDMRDDGLTLEEGVVMDALVLAWNYYVKLEQTHPQDLMEFNDAIHKCQYLLGGRILRRDYPKGWITHK